MPVASIIIPCYNAEKFVKDTVNSARRQTVHDIEIVCVDDGSTDQTLPTLEHLAKLDGRIRIIRQPNGGEGPARDAGLTAATGEWLYFLDSDDLMEPTLLEEAIAACERHGADLVVFRTLLLDMQTGEERLCDWSFKRDWIDDDVFCPREHPRRIFNSFQNWVHNKLFRASFVRGHDLHIQHVHRTADLLFTCRALAEAERIALLDRALHRYRVNNPQSAMMTGDAFPLDFYRAFCALREALEEQGLWELYHDSFVNWAIEGAAVNVRLARSFEGYRAMVGVLRDEGIERLDIASFPREKSDMPVCYDQVHALTALSAEEALFDLVKFFRSETDGIRTYASHKRRDNQQLRHTIIDLEERVRVLEADVRHAREERDVIAQDRDVIAQDRENLVAEFQQDMSNVLNSASFKVGRAATFVPRHARDAAQYVRDKLL